MNLICLLGPTSSGKSEMAVSLAKDLINRNLRVWVVGCDSRQVYKFLDYGTGKVKGFWQAVEKNKQMFYPSKEVFFYQEIPHFLIDYKNPYTDFDFSLVGYLSDFYSLFKSTKILPDVVILTGGTGLYARAILKKYELLKIREEFITEAQKFKQNLDNQNLLQLQKNYQSLNLIKLNHSDFNNTRRLVNKIYQHKIQSQNWGLKISYPTFKKTFNFAIKTDFNLLKEKIATRLKQRFDQGLVQEVLENQKLGQEKMLNLGLEYRLGYQYIIGMVTKEELLFKLKVENFRYAKRQITWLKKQKPIWVDSLAKLLLEIDI